MHQTLLDYVNMHRVRVNLRDPVRFSGSVICDDTKSAAINLVLKNEQLIQFLEILHYFSKKILLLKICPI